MDQTRQKYLFELWLKEEFDDALLEHLSPHVRHYFQRKLEGAFNAGVDAAKDVLRQQALSGAVSRLEECLKAPQ